MPFVRVAAALLVLGACSSQAEPVELIYRFEEGRTTRYEMRARGSASWDIGGPGEGSYDVTLEVSETIQRVGEEGALVSVVMRPTRVRENGLPSPGDVERRFSLIIDADGRVDRVLEVDGRPAGALDPDELVFIGTYRPPLPPRRVAVDDRWQARQSVQVGSVLRQLVTRGLVEAIEDNEGTERAHLSYEGRGPLVWTARLPEGAAELRGSASTDATATFDVRAGVLASARSLTRGDFDVRVVPFEGQPSIAGRLRLRLTLELTRLR